MIGTDIIEIERVAKSAQKPSFLKKVYTPQEIAYYEQNGKNAETLAGMFAAKEAVAKAIGLGFSGFNMTDIEVGHNPNGSPHIITHNNAAAIFAPFNIHISISHNQTTALAAALLIPKQT